MNRSLRLAVLLSVLLASPLAAQEEKGSLLSLEPGLMIWTVAIFLIVLLVLYKAAYPKLLGAVEARERHIRELLAAAKRDREEAEALRAEQKRELEEVRQRSQELVAEGRTAGERLREEILGQARREQAELLERTRRDVQREMEQAMAELKAQVVDVAIAAAGKLVERNLDAEDNRRLVREFLEEASFSDAPAGA
jgi:F-type H+-transporting ATPase subunit b